MEVSQMGSVAADSRRLSDEDFIILRAKQALNVDSYAAKAWMVTAKTLFPNNFSVQFEAYRIVKSAKNIKEAAKSFEALLKQFGCDSELWKEVEAVTNALRPEVSTGHDSAFLRTMFAELSVEAQQQLLLVTANRSKDTMGHVCMLLLLVSRFKQAASKHIPLLLDILLTAEKHEQSTDAVNSYRKILVSEVVPLLEDSVGSVEIPLKQLYYILNKTMVYYFSCLKPKESMEHNPWGGLFDALRSLGKLLNWGLFNQFYLPWNRELVRQQLFTEIPKYLRTGQAANPEAHQVKQFVYCAAVYFLRSLYDYLSALHSGEHQLLLIEAFTFPSPELTNSEPPSKKRKLQIGYIDCTQMDKPAVTVDTPPGNGIVNNSVTSGSAGSRSAASPPVVMHLQTTLDAWEFMKTDSCLAGTETLLYTLGVDDWVTSFKKDVQIYSGNADGLIKEFLDPKYESNPDSQSQSELIRNLLLSSCYLNKGNYQEAVERALRVVELLHTLPQSGTPSNSLFSASGPNHRHLHFLRLARTPVLQYCVNVLINALKNQWSSKPGATGSDHDLGIGHMITLLQLDLDGDERPNQSAMDLLASLLERIRVRGAFSYPLFVTYIINCDILEEIMYLASKQGGPVSFEIIPLTNAQIASQRRISTRGVDKGAKEDFKSAMRRQMIRSGEPLEPLLIKFLTTERDSILRAL